MSFAAGSQDHSSNGLSAVLQTSVRRSKRGAKLLIILLLVAVLLSQILVVISPSLSPSASEEDKLAKVALITASFSISPTTGRIGEEITFFANASSDVASMLNFTIYYDYVLADGVTPNPYSPVSRNVTGNPGSVITKFTYGAVGNCTGGTYQVALLVFDGFTTKRSVRYVTILPGNSAPYFAPPLGASYPAEVGVPIEFSVTVYDVDNDELTLTWDFGDGISPVIETTGPAAAGVVCTQTHAWNPPPESTYGIGDTYINYSVVLTLEDGRGGNASTPSVVSIYLPHNFSPKGTLAVSGSVVDPSDVVSFNATASDSEGEPLTWTFLFSDGTEVFRIEVCQTPLTAPGTTLYVNLTHVFDVVGNYTVVLYLTDVVIPEYQTGSHNATVGTIHVTSIGNRVPYVLAEITVIPQDVYFDEDAGFASVLLRIQTNDPDGDVLSAVWDFGDGSDPQTNISLGGTQVCTFIQPHVFYLTGPFNVSVVVTDGRPGHEVLRYRLVNVTSNNSAPEVRDFIVILSNSSYGAPGSIVQFILIVFDLERDPVSIVWDFGDGSALFWTNVTAFDATGNSTCYANHSYSSVGKYVVWINYTDNVFGRDGYHSSTWTGFVTIDIPKEIVVRVWDWWDYTSLGLFGALCALVAAWPIFGAVKRGRLDRMGMTMEEYLIKRQLEEDALKPKGPEGL